MYFCDIPGMKTAVPLPDPAKCGICPSYAILLRKPDYDGYVHRLD